MSRDKMSQPRSLGKRKQRRKPVTKPTVHATASDAQSVPTNFMTVLCCFICGKLTTKTCAGCGCRAYCGDVCSARDTTHARVCAAESLTRRAYAPVKPEWKGRADRLRVHDNVFQWYQESRPQGWERLAEKLRALPNFNKVIFLDADDERADWQLLTLEMAVKRLATRANLESMPDGDVGHLVDAYRHKTASQVCMFFNVSSLVKIQTGPHRGRRERVFEYHFVRFAVEDSSGHLFNDDRHKQETKTPVVKGADCKPRAAGESKAETTKNVEVKAEQMSGDDQHDPAKKDTDTKDGSTTKQRLQSPYVLRSETTGEMLSAVVDHEQDQYILIGNDLPSTPEMPPPAPLRQVQTGLVLQGRYRGAVDISLRERKSEILKLQCFPGRLKYAWLLVDVDDKARRIESRICGKADLYSYPAIRDDVQFHKYVEHCNRECQFPTWVRQRGTATFLAFTPLLPWLIDPEQGGSLSDVMQTLMTPKEVPACAKCLKPRNELQALQPPRRLLKCVACKMVAYCGTECQTAHWAEHRAACLKARGQ